MKGKGTAGGNLVTIKTQEEYNFIMKLLKQEIQLKDLPYKPGKRLKMKYKAMRFQIQNNHQEGEWLHGLDVLWIKIFPPKAKLEDLQKPPLKVLRFIPKWYTNHIIKNFHDKGPCGHFSRDRLHDSVRFCEY